MDYITHKFKLYSRCDRNKYLHRDIDAFAGSASTFARLEGGRVRQA